MNLDVGRGPLSQRVAPSAFTAFMPAGEDSRVVRSGGKALSRNVQEFSRHLR